MIGSVSELRMSESQFVEPSQDDPSKVFRMTWRMMRDVDEENVNSYTIKYFSYKCYTYLKWYVVMHVTYISQNKHYPLHGGCVSISLALTNIPERTPF